MACSTTKKPECYAYVTDRDTINVTLAINRNNVDGNVIYKIYEKDRNLGNFQGVLMGEKIVAQYEFMSEGVLSSREITFIKKGETLVDVSTGLELKKVDCR